MNHQVVVIGDGQALDLVAAWTLQERERTKLAAVTAAIGDALQERGTESRRARLAAQIAALIFQNAFDQWLGVGEQADFAMCLAAATALFREAATGDTENHT